MKNKCTIQYDEDDNLVIPKKTRQKLGFDAVRQITFKSGCGIVVVFPTAMNATDCIVAAEGLHLASAQMLDKVINACGNCDGNDTCYTDLLTGAEKDDTQALQEHFDTLPADMLACLMASNVCLMDLLDLLERGDPIED